MMGDVDLRDLFLHRGPTNKYLVTCAHSHKKPRGRQVTYRSTNSWPALPPTLGDFQTFSKRLKSPFASHNFTDDNICFVQCLLSSKSRPLVQVILHCECEMVKFD